jgi:hypothetical protein
MASYYIVQADLSFAILLLLPPECWDYRHAPSHLAKPLLSSSLKHLMKPSLLGFSETNISFPPWMFLQWEISSFAILIVLEPFL